MHSNNYQPWASSKPVNTFGEYLIVLIFIPYLAEYLFFSF
jgi:hypothetical protein